VSETSKKYIMVTYRLKKECVIRASVKLVKICG
jgi:hypothetical protein